MKYQLLYADEAGVSHWTDVHVGLTPIEFAPPAGNIHLSEPEAAAQAVFLRLPAGWNEPKHPSPRAQMLVCRSGAVEVTASDGEKRIIGPGDVWRMEDTHGEGHHTRVVSDEAFDAVVVQYP
ncbi:cupin domain-containing protein [Alphaproteobacteria bacterium GH1-50]|uniref:Cupin domain-containing protein n=1 Tax=Kangsaoukella pontilimi TaxID=2691042 RepID=A0A7C9IHV0_9RHOB|nr:cupin domain-containing protein [Kangsaoukella pontilimi]MXQ09328.1 cupin domain-containing protein [Kangsaoukella pontilimi]